MKIALQVICHWITAKKIMTEWRWNLQTAQHVLWNKPFVNNEAWSHPEWLSSVSWRPGWFLSHGSCPCVCEIWPRRTILRSGTSTQSPTWSRCSEFSPACWRENNKRNMSSCWSRDVSLQCSSMFSYVEILIPAEGSESRDCIAKTWTHRWLYVIDSALEIDNMHHILTLFRDHLLLRQGSYKAVLNNHQFFS